MSVVVPWEEPVEDLTEAPQTIISPEGEVVARLNMTTADIYDDVLSDSGFPPIHDAPPSPAAASAWEKPGPHDAEADLRRAWDSMVDNIVGGWLRG